MNNPSVGINDLSDIVISRGRNAEQGAGKHLLILNDTVEFNYNGLNGLFKVRDPNIGPISDNKSSGFFMHPCIVVDPQVGIPYGFSSLQIWNRSFYGPDRFERKYRSLPIEEKESNKWLVAAQQSKEWLAPGNTMTMVGDRESDIYEYFADVPDEKTHVLVRSNWDRKVSSGLKLSDELNQIDWQFCFEVDIAGNRNRIARRAKLQTRWRKVEIVSNRHKSSKYPDSIQLTVVEVLEHDTSVPSHEKPIHWRLFTTHSVNEIDQAIEIVKWYKWRWWIEDFFRILKTQGLEVERSQFATGIALKKLVVLCLEAALRILTLRQQRQNQSPDSAAICFEEEELAFLNILDEEQQKVVSSTNDNPINSLAWATWIIAVLGGWTPADMNKRPPGVITLSRGLNVYRQRFLGWQTALRYFQQVTKNSS